jgi:hypothetical protein
VKKSHPVTIQEIEALLNSIVLRIAIGIVFGSVISVALIYFGVI